MDDIERPDIFDALHDLFHDDTRFFLAYVASGFEQHAEIEPIRILLHHVDIGACLNRLM